MNEKKKKKSVLASLLLLLGGNLGKSLLFGALIILAVLGASLLRMKAWTMIAADGYVMTEDVSDTLKNGLADAEKEYVALYPVSAYDEVFSRMGNLYVGEELQKLEKGYPQFLGNGSGIRFLIEGSSLIGEDMVTYLPVYDGLRVNGGNSFGEDGMQADVENFVLTGLSNGLYINAQNIQLTYASVTDTIPADSILYFGDSEVRAYTRENGTLHYTEITKLMAARIRIGNLDMNYRDFLELLRNRTEGSGVDEPKDPSAWEEAEAKSGEVIDTSALSGSGDENPDTDRTGGEEEKGGKNTGSGQGDRPEASSGAQKGSSAGGTNAEGGQQSGGAGSGSGTSGSSGSDTSSSSNSGSGKDDGGSGNGASEETGEGNEDGDLIDGDGILDIGDHVPVVTAGDFTAEAYHIRTSAKVEDEYGQLYKLTYTLYWGTDDLKTIKMRKSVRSRQLSEDGMLDIDLSLVPPGSKVRIEGTFTYYNNEQEKIEKEFLPEGGITVTTMTIEEGLKAGLLSEIQLKYDNTEEILPRLTNQLQLPELQTTVPEIMKEYMYRAAVRVTVHGKDDYLDIPFTSADLRKLKAGESVAWISENSMANTDFLTSNTVFDYQILFQDKFGNDLPAEVYGGTGAEDTAEYVSGVAATAKRTPSVTITEQRLTNPDAATIGDKTLTLKLNNPDHAPLLAEQVSTSAGQVGRKLYLQIYTLIGGEEAPLAVDALANPQLTTLYEGSWIVLDEEQMTSGSGQELVIHNLPADKGTTYSFKVFGNYNLTPDHDVEIAPEEDIYRSQIGIYQSASLAITRLGYGYFNMQSTAQDTTASVTAAMTNSTGEGLRGLFSRFELQLLEGDTASVRGAKEKYTAQLRKSDFYNGDTPLTFPETGAYTLCMENGKYKVTVQGQQGEEIWKTLCYDNPTLHISYENLNSTLYYQVKINTYVEQGYTGSGTKEHDVTGSSNTSTFRMLKLTPVVSASNFYTVSDFIEIRGLQIYDKDGVITGTSTDQSQGTSGNVIVQLQLRNGSDWETVQSRVVNTTSDPSERLSNIRFKGLGSNQEYRVKFIAVSYNNTWSSSNEQLAKEIGIVQDEWMLTTGTGITSSLALLGASEALAYVDAGSIDSLNLIDSEAVTTGQYLDGKGSLTETTDTNWWTTDYIKVTPGDVMMLYRVRRDSNGHYVSFYTGQSEDSIVTLRGTQARLNLNASTYRQYYEADYGMMDYMLFRVPDDVSYMKLSAHTSTVYQCGFNSTKLFSLSQMGLLDASNPDAIFNGISGNNGGELYTDEREADYIKGKMYNAVNKTEVANGSYSLSGKIPVTPEHYYVKLGGTPDVQSYVGFYDEDDKLIEVRDQLYVGFKFQAPEGASYMRIADYTAAVDGSDRHQRLSVREYNSNMIDSGKILMADESGDFYANVRSQVSDPTGDLRVDASDAASRRKYIIRWYSREGVDGADTSDPLLAEEEVFFDSETVTNYHQKQLEGYSSFCVTIWVDLYGEEILLSELSFTTEEVTYSLGSDADLSKLAMFPYGKFVVVDDFTMTRSATAVSEFYGKIDGQGHTITNATTHGIVNYLRDGSEVKNLVLDWNYQINSAFGDRGSLATYDNYGTCSNIIVNINLSGAFPIYTIGGIVRRNYGTIENFAIVYGKDLTVSRVFGGACAYNDGIVKNGYAYVPSNVRVNFASAQYLGNPANVVYYCSTVVGLNQNGGIIQNVYSVGNINVEKQNSDWNTSSCGLAVGINTSATVQNLLARGDRYVYSINEVTNVQGSSSVFSKYGGNAVGIHSGAYDEKNICYISPQEYDYNYANQQRAEDSDLWNLTFMNTLLNGDGSFLVEEMVPAGYYPQINMMETMMEKQPTISLPSTVGLAAPEVLDAQMVETGIDESGAEYVLANIRFLNNRKRQVTELVFDGLDCEILGYPEGSDDYTVQVKLTNPQYYRSSYELKSFTYRASAIGDAVRTVEYGADTPNGEKYLEVEFWRTISSVDEWNTYLSSDQIDMEGNYQIAADLDFAGLNGEKAVEISRKPLGNNQYESFTGKIRGIDPTGGAKRPAIKNYPAEKGYIIEQMTGAEIENLLFSQIDFSAAPENLTNKGILGTVSDSSISHIQIEGVEMPGVSQYAGALAGTIQGTTVEYCSASDVKLRSVQADGISAGLAVGGLLGKAEASTIHSCFVSAIDLQATEGAGAEGIGGLVGWLTGNGKLEDCYAQGSINSSFGNAGGLAGKSECAIRRVWTDVSVVSVANGIGGILGSAEKSLTVGSVFAAGEVYSKTGSTEKVGRIYGNEIGNVKVTTNRAFAYEGQMINGQSVDDKRDAYGLLSSAQLSGDNAKVGWSRRIGLGSAFRLLGEASPQQVSGQLPYLLDEDGTSLMPGQTAHLMKDLSLAMNPVSYQKDVPGKTDTNYPYRLQLSFVQQRGGSPYKVQSVAVEGMTVAESIEDKYLPEYTDQVSEADNTLTTSFYAYTGLLSYQDNYRVTLTVAKEDGSSQTLSGVLQFKEEDIPYLVIHNFAEWKEYLGSGANERNLGQSYQNIKIDGGIDFSEGKLSSAAMAGYLNIRAGKVKGTEKAVLKGLDYTASKSSEAVFSDISGSIDQIRFENMTLDASINGGSSIGMIGHLQGNGSGLSFENVTVKGGTASEVGCIGTCEGSLTEITMDNIRVTARGNYIGGLAGLARGDISKVTLEGSDTVYTPGADGKEGTADYGSQIVNEASAQGTGGILGIGYGVFSDITVTGTWVKGYQRVGAVSGYSNQSQNLNIRVGMLNPKDKDGNDMPYSAAVEGRDYVAGVSGYVQSGTYSTTVNYYENVLVQQVSVRATNSLAGGIGTYAIRTQDCSVEDCYIFASSTYAGGASTNWCTLYNTTVRGSTIQAGTNSGGIAAYAVSTYNCYSYDNVITGTQYVGGILGRSYNSSIISSGSSNNVIGGDNTQYAGGIVGGSHADTSLTYYTVIRNSFCKDSTVRASFAAGGIIGYARGGQYTAIYSNAAVSAAEQAGGFAGAAEGYIKNATDYRRMQIDSFYFTGTVNAALKYAGGLFGYYSPGEQQRNGDGSNYLGEYLPVNFNQVTRKDDGTTVNDGKIYLQRIVIASGSVNAGEGKAVVANFAGYNSEPEQEAGTIPELYVYEGSSGGGGYTGYGSQTANRGQLASPSFYEGIGFNGNYWNYMGLNEDSMADASIIPQGDGKLELNLPEKLTDGSYTAEIMTDNYIQDESLVLWLDALNNTGSGYDPDAAYWTNLASADENGQMESYKLNNFAKGSWKSNGLHFDGVNQYINTINNGELGHTIYTDGKGKYTGATISIMLKMDDDNYSKHNIVITDRSSTLGGYELNFNSNGATYLYVDDMALNAGNVGTLGTGFNNSTWPALYNENSAKNIAGKYVQLTMVMRTYLGSERNTTCAEIYLDGELFYSITDRTGGFESRYGNLLRIGQSSSSLKGTVGSIMGYDKALKKEEVAQNARVNQLRYNSRLDGKDGSEGSGSDTVVKKEITVSGGKATIELDGGDYSKLFGDEEEDGRQLYVRINTDTSGTGTDYVGGNVTYPLSVHAPAVKSTAYVDSEFTAQAPDVNEAGAGGSGTGTTNASGSGWDYRNQPYVKIESVGGSLKDVSYQWYSGNTSGYDGTKISGETSDTLQLTGNGYYYCRITATENYMNASTGVIESRTVYGYSKVYRHMTDSYMPYLRDYTSANNYKTLEIQEGFYEKDGVLVPYSTEDAICSGGVPVPGGLSTLNLTRALWLFGRASEPAPEVMVYAAGANILNVEFDSNIPYMDETYFGTCWFTLEADGTDVILPEGVLASTVFTDEDGRERTGYYIDNRVYSLYYDFQTELTITTWSEFFDHLTGESYLDSQECKVVPEDVARRVMTWDDSYAYINNQDMLNGTIGKLSHEGGFVNLYGGMALTADGQLVDLSEEPSYAEADTAMAVLAQSVPLYSGTYGGYGIETYAGFTSTTLGAERYTNSRQLFVKNGQLFTTGTLGEDNRPVQDGYILDTYQNYRYLTVLENGARTELKDVEQPIHYPSGFANYNIAHISNTLDNSADSHIVLGCYESGGIWGFDYFTGEWLDLDSDADGGNFLTYLLGSVRARFFNTIPAANPDYDNALALETSLGVYLLENGDELPDGGTNGFGDTVDDGSLLSLDQETAIPTEEPGVINANGETAEAGGLQEEGTGVGKTDSAVSAADASETEKAVPEEEGAMIPGGVLHEDEGMEAEGAPGELTGITGIKEKEEEPSEAEAGAPADPEGSRAYGIPKDEEEGPDKMTDGASDADGTAVTEAAVLAKNEELMTVYDASAGSYGVYDAADILTAPDDQLETMDIRLANMGMDLTAIRLEQQSILTEKEQKGIDVLLIISGSVLALLGGMGYVHRRRKQI